jgi:hypothetical protein
MYPDPDRWPSDDWWVPLPDDGEPQPIADHFLRPPGYLEHEYET